MKDKREEREIISSRRGRNGGPRGTHLKIRSCKATSERESVRKDLHIFSARRVVDPEVQDLVSSVSDGPPSEDVECSSVRGRRATVTEGDIYSRRAPKILVNLLRQFQALSPFDHPPSLAVDRLERG